MFNTLNTEDKMDISLKNENVYSQVPNYYIIIFKYLYS